jgi:hypothetical protein
MYEKVEFLIRNVNIHVVLNRNAESNIIYKYQLNLHSIRSHSTDKTVGFVGYNTMERITLRLNRTPISGTLRLNRTPISGTLRLIRTPISGTLRLNRTPISGTLRLNRTPIYEQDIFPMNPLHTTVSKSSSEAAKTFLL